MQFTTDFHNLYKKYATDIYRYALYLCRNSAEAEDMTSETFVRALTAKVPLAAISAKAYLFTVTRNLHLESLRRRKKMTELSPEIPDSHQNLEDVYNHKEELDKLKAYLQNFPETDRSALFLRAEGLAYNEIAEALEISIAAAKVKVHRMRLKLAEWRTKK